MSDADRTDGGLSERPGSLGRLGQAMVSPDSYGLVLLLIVATYAVSVAATAVWASSVVVAVQIATVWVVLGVSQAHRAVRRLASLLLVVSGVAAVVNLFTGGEPATEGVITMISALLYLIAPFSILRHLATRPEVDRQTLLGAIDTYLLIGMLFGFLYRFLAVASSAPFFGPNGDGVFAQDLFFSFTTLTTTGYGNLVPAGNPGQTLSVLEMLIGQLFLVTAVAKIVSAFRPARRSEP